MHLLPRAEVEVDWAGITGAVIRLAQEQARAGCSVVGIYDASLTRPPVSEVEWIAFGSFGKRRGKLMLGVGPALRGADVLVIHRGWLARNATAAFSATWARVPFILSPRGSYDPEVVARGKHIRFLAWERQMLARAMGVQIFFEEEEEHLRALGYDGPVVIAPNGIEAPAGIRWDGGSGGYLAWMGRLDVRHKGLDLIMDALALMPAQDRPQVRLYGVETRESKEEVSSLARKLGVGSSITLHDPVFGNEKWDVMAQARGFLYPSRWEGFGNSVAEAAAIGLPVLVTPYPLGRLLAARKGAVLAEPNARSVADGIGLLLSEGASTIGRRGAEVASAELAWPAIARSWIDQVSAQLSNRDQTK